MSSEDARQPGIRAVVFSLARTLTSPQGCLPPQFHTPGRTPAIEATLLHPGTPKLSPVLVREVRRPRLEVCAHPALRTASSGPWLGMSNPPHVRTPIFPGLGPPSQLEGPTLPGSCAQTYTPSSPDLQRPGRGGSGDVANPGASAPATHLRCSWAGGTSCQKSSGCIQGDSTEQNHRRPNTAPVGGGPTFPKTPSKAGGTGGGSAHRAAAGRGAPWITHSVGLPE